MKIYFKSRINTHSHTHIRLEQKFTAINSLQFKYIQKVNAKKQGVYQYTPQHDFRVCEGERRECDRKMIQNFVDG